ncbi:MAG: uracil-DNA glycosylase [Streptosporangiales bacterium]
MHVPPGSGWPEDPATARTPVAADADGVAHLADAARSIGQLDARVSVCRACPRLVEWREQVARERRRAYAGETYWGRPVPSFGDTSPRVLVVGLAPAAHGANRTGRMFTGDRSGEWLFRALYRAGLATAPVSTAAGDGLQLPGARVVAPVHCAPPANKPTPDERDACEPWLVREMRLVRGSVRVVVALGAFAWQAAWRGLRLAEYPLPPRRAAFGHGAEMALPEGRLLIGSYHPSQQNTFTGKLTETMFDAVFTRAATFGGDAV